MEEHWKEIPGYEGLYEVSNQGRVRSVDRIVESENQFGKYQVLFEGRILRHWKNKDGYLQVCLHKNGRPKHFSVHRLVAMVFIPNPHNYPIINHKDERPWNNAVSNLEWCTYEYNNNYGTCRQRISESMKGMTRSDETKRRMSEAHKGMTFSEEHKRRLSEAMKGEKHPMYGKHLSEETRRKMSEARPKKPVACYTKSGEFVNEFPSTIEASRRLNCSQGNIVSCLKGRKKSYNGYVWRYVDEREVI